MKKDMIKKALLSLSIAFAATAVVGVGAVVNTNADDEATINSAFSTLALQNGASIRYAAEGEDATQEGFSYVLQMSAEQYNAVMAEDSAFSNVKFGILIGPEAYYDVYAFDNQANLDAYYSLNEEVAGKAFLYDMQATEFVGNEETVYYRGSIVEVLDANMIRDYRGVGYVEYTVDGVSEKFFFTDDSNVRCPVEIADLTIDTLDAETDADKIEALKTRYINQVDWTITPSTHSDGRWMQHWNNYAFGTTGSSPAPIVSWDASNRYINSKYETVYTFERGEEVVAYTDTEAVKALEGVWTIKGVTTCEFLPEPVVSYTRNVTFQKLGGPSSNFPTVNGNTINANAAGVLWKEAEGMYEQVDNWNVLAGYYKKATGNFIVDFELNGANTSEFRIWTSANTWIAFVAKDGGNTAGNDGVYMYTHGVNARADVGSWWTEIRLGGNANVFTNPSIRGVGNLKMRAVNYANTLYIFSNTYWDGNAVATADDYTLVAAFYSDGTTTPATFNGMSWLAANSWQYVRESVAEIYSAATAKEFAFGTRSTSTALRALIDLNDDDAAVYNFLANNESMQEVAISINGEFLPRVNEQHWTQDENGFWNESGTDNTRVKLLDKASGDYMFALKMKTTFELDFRIYSSTTQYVTFMTYKDQNSLFMQNLTTWATETVVGATDSANFYTEYNNTADGGDGYLDLLFVRYNNELYIYSCETLATEGETSVVKTATNWKLFMKIASDGNVTYGDGIARESSNGFGGFTTGVKTVMSANDNVFAFRHRNGNESGKIVVVDDDAAVAAFMASDKAVATYAKA